MTRSLYLIYTQEISLPVHFLIGEDYWVDSETGKVYMREEHMKKKVNRSVVRITILLQK